MFTGIFTGAIAQRFGPRKCGLFGAITYSAGLLISSFATSTTYLQISYGVISGIVLKITPEVGEPPPRIASVNFIIIYTRKHHSREPMHLNSAIIAWWLQSRSA